MNDDINHLDENIVKMLNFSIGSGFVFIKARMSGDGRYTEMERR